MLVPFPSESSKPDPPTQADRVEESFLDQIVTVKEASIRSGKYPGTIMRYLIRHDPRIIHRLTPSGYIIYYPSLSAIWPELSQETTP